MQPNITFITESQDLLKALPEIDQMPIITVDTETTGLDPYESDVLLLQVGNPLKQFIIDCRKTPVEPLRPLLEGSKPKILHNAKFDYKMIRHHFKIEMENMVDTMLVEQVLMNGKVKSGFGLKDLAPKYLGIEVDKTEQKSFIGHKGDFSRSQLEYAARDVISTYLLAMEQLPRLRQEGLESTAQLECLTVSSFGDIELNGFHMDQKKWMGLVEEAKVKRDVARQALNETFAGVNQKNLFGLVEMNYDSDQQLKEALHRLGIPVEDTSRNTLIKIQHPAIDRIFDYREQQKIVTTYGEVFLNWVKKYDGRIHPDFHQLGAESGRVSCTRPNLQNIPAGSDFRSCFTAPESRKIITADYSGCELRILAELSRDPTFIEAFRNNRDLHSIVATQMYNKPVSKKENKELRDKAKIINFGLAYGMGPGALSITLNTTPKEAEALLKGYFKTFPKIKEYLEKSAREALERGYSQTMGGRKRYFTIPKGDDRAERGAIERQAKNMPIQGTNADMIKLALTLVRAEIKKHQIDAKVVNTVHDEMVVECIAHTAEEVATIVRDKMVEAGEHFLKTIPVDVECTTSDHWSK